jgi:type I restriction enzyme, S subunit
VMTSGNTTTLGEASYINPRLTERLDDDASIAFVPMAAVSAEEARVIAPAERPYSEVKKGYTCFETGDVLVAKITPCFENGKIAQAILPHKVGFGSTEFHVVRPKHGVSDGRYLHHYLRQPHIRTAGERRMTGSGGQRRVPEDYLASLPLPLPAVAEQRRIAAILDQADALRAQRQQALAELEKLAQAVFVEMFGDTVTNSMEWPFLPIGKLADVQGGLQVTSARKELPIEAPYLRVANVHRGYLLLDEIKTIRATPAEIARTTLCTHDLLVVEGHGNPEEIGRAALWSGELRSCVHQNHLIRVRFDNSKVNPVYACTYLNSTGGRRHLLRAGKTTSGLNTISVSNVREAPVALPPVELQKTFATRMEAIEAHKASRRAALAESDALFASLQHHAFSGAL